MVGFPSEYIVMARLDAGDMEDITVKSLCKDGSSIGLNHVLSFRLRVKRAMHRPEMKPFRLHSIKVAREMR